MDYKNEYLVQKQKYLELRDSMMRQLAYDQTGSGITDTNIFTTIANTLFGTINLNNSESGSEGGARPIIKQGNEKNVEVIFFRESDLQFKTNKNDEKIKKLIDMDLKTRVDILDDAYYNTDVSKIGDSKINMVDVNASLSGKSYSVKIGNDKATLIQSVSKQVSPQLGRLSQQPVKSSSPVNPMTKQISLPNMKLTYEQQILEKLTDKEKGIYNFCQTFTNLTPDQQQKCLVILPKIKGKYAQQGGELIDFLFGGADMPDTVSFKNKMESGELFNKQDLLMKLNLINAQLKNKGSKIFMDTVMVIEKNRGPNNDETYIIRIFRKDFDLII